MKALRHGLLGLLLILLAGCSVIQSQEGSPVPLDSHFAVIPLVNLSQTPQAGDQAAGVLAAILRAKGSENVSRHLPEKQNPLDYDTKERQRSALSAARRDGADYIFTGTVEEWRYKSGLDGEPAVGMTLEIRRATDDEVVWSGTSARTGWGRESVSVAAHKVLDKLTGAMPLVTRR